MSVDEALAIAVSNLNFSYPDQPTVLQNLNFTIREGERVGLIGPNGAGKTTLFFCLCGVLSPTSGEIQLWDKPVEVGQFRPEIGLVFQNPNDQLFSASVWDDVAFGPENMGLSPDRVKACTEEALSLTGVTELADRPPHHLSGGQKRMVAIASVLSMHPQAIIYDEPSANLDLRSRRRLINFLQASRETLLISSHDLDLILEVTSRTLLLDSGNIIADGPTVEVMGNTQTMIDHGLEVPYRLQ
ncbi:MULTISPECIES: ABC transporter ATP-binding protein [unclassified Roseofilum]|uniref:energy-coupling factor ABC transporter ATP-binding protein n=1 Tax=unclassified Roseofilum TaxID=2620099 RepID=UPI000E86D40A|nr:MULTISPECIES: ABC transporter ATP-binding protein [unclassified Roseofilum]MBP0010747.1 ABC transporter ATP-binding protein [Roseofilum sp. Belize Diploria]MBP0035074.1 ABC transporter ATP-binding protein [Roseofilum sp. Belize BBD 4]MBP0040529.1 ABC transporter ATP-binding protein [Roseofilum sp. SBFL]HBQ97633.1 ABC transporter ATP-binding protein [Cyanobacteria bacterium UBA11691]